MCLLHLIEWSVTYVAIPHYCIILGLSILNWTFYFSFPFRRPGLITNCLGTPRPCNDSSMLRCVRNCRRYYYSPIISHFVFHIHACPAFSTHAIWSCVFNSCVFHPVNFMVPRFPVPRFQRTHGDTSFLWEPRVTFWLFDQGSDPPTDLDAKWLKRHVFTQG